MKAIKPSCAALALVSILNWGCHKGQPPKQFPAVTVSHPEERSVTEYLYFTGNAEAGATVELRARVSGFLESAYFKDGGLVNEGDLLFQIEAEPFEAKLKLAEAQIAASQAEAARAEQEYSRQIELVKKNATSQAEVEKWRAARDAAQARLDQAKASADLARIELSYTKIAAPFKGRMDRRLKDPGSLVGAAEATLLSTIRSIDPIYAYFQINERDLQRLRQKKMGQGEQLVESNQRITAELGLPSEDDYSQTGELDFAATAVDPGTGSLLLRASFPNRLQGVLPWILPGMFVRIRVPADKIDQALLVPDAAFGVDQLGQYLLAVNDKDVVEQRPVKTSFRTDDGLRVVLSGISAADWIVVEGMQQAKRGSQVKPVRRESPVPAAAAPEPAAAPANQ